MAEDGIVWKKEMPEETVEMTGEATEMRGIGETGTTEVIETEETTGMIEIEETIAMIEETEDEEFVVRLNCVTAPSTF